MYFETTKQGNCVGAADVVDGDDVRVVEVGDGAGLGQVGFGVVGPGDQMGVRHLDRHGALQLVVVGQVDEAEAALAQQPLDAVAADVRRQRGGGVSAEGRGWGRDAPGRRGRAGIRTCPEPRKQRPDLRVDELEFLPPLPDFRQQLGAVAAHLLRRLPRVEHLLEQFEHLGVAGHGSFLKVGACHPAAT